MKYTKEQHLEHVAAFWDKRLEMLVDGKWLEVLSAPESTDHPECYRIRPEPRLRPWKPDEVPVGAMLRTKNTGNPYRWLIVAVCQDGITTCGGRNVATYKENYALETCEHSTDGGKTWLPCGVEEQG